MTEKKMMEKFLQMIYYVGANNAYSEFIKSLSSNNNEKIEETSLIKLLDKAIENGSELESIINKGTMLYRARNVKDVADLPILDNNSDDDKFLSGFNEYDSKDPPFGVSSEGRWNYKGASYLYLSEDQYTACAEIKPEFSYLLSLATFQIKEGLKIIDFTNDKKLKTLNEFAKGLDIGIGCLITNVMRQYTIPIENTEEYIASQYISDYFRKAGYDGIAYRSSQTGHTCYVIFKSHKKYIKFMGSKLVVANRKRYSFTDFTNDTFILDGSYIAPNNETRKIQKKKIIDARKHISGKKS